MKPASKPKEQAIKFEFFQQWTWKFNKNPMPPWFTQEAALKYSEKCGISTERINLITVIFSVISEKRFWKCLATNVRN